MKPCWQCRTLTGESYDVETLLEFDVREDRGLPVCDACVVKRLHRRASIAGVVLLVVWLLTLMHGARVLMTSDLPGVWLFANIVPVVIIAFFVTGFFYDGIWALISREGRRRAVEAWFFRERRRV